MRRTKIEDQKIASNEMTKAISAFKSRLFRDRGQHVYAEFLARVKSLAEQDSISDRIATINIARMYPYDLEKMSPEELPLWGYRAEPLLETERRKVLEDTKAGVDPQAMLADRPAFKNLKDDVREQSALSLLLVNVPLDRACPEREAMLWALNRVSLPYSAIDPDDVPSRLAMEILLICREDKDFHRDLMKKYLDKTLPSKPQMELEQQFQESGRRMEEFLAGVISSLEEETLESLCSEESITESPLPPGSAEGMSRR